MQRIQACRVGHFGPCRVPKKQDGFNKTREGERKTYKEDALELLKGIDALSKELVLDLVTDHL